VDDDMANIIVAQLLYLDAVDPTKDIVMYVNSPGGSVTAGNNNFVSLLFIFFPVLWLMTRASLTLPRHGYIRYYEAHPA
jgi:ATP-dependent protease ClpP protease subunit